MWSCTLFDSITGLLGEPIDIPNVSWTVSVSDCSLSTVRDKDTGEDEINSLTLPWEAVPGANSQSKQAAIASYKRGLLLSYDGTPVVAGIIGERKDSWLDTSFSIISPMSFLANRYIVREDTFGKSTFTSDKGETTKNVTTSTVRYDNLSFRAIACDLIRLATEAKPGGQLPLNLPYLGESGKRSREYYGYNVANNDCAKLLKELANCQNGPDIQFRPELLNEQYMCWTLYAGSEAEPLFLGNSPTPTLTAFPRGGSTAENVVVAHDGATHRIYQTGAGTDQATLCYLAENLTLVQRRDPYPLVELSKSNSDDDNIGVVQSHAKSNLESYSYPVCQITCDVNASDPLNPVKPGLVWPGEPVNLAINDHPALPDGVYELRLMEMSGDLGQQISLTFDVMPDPYENM